MLRFGAEHGRKAIGSRVAVVETEWILLPHDDEFPHFVLGPQCNAEAGIVLRKGLLVGHSESRSCLSSGSERIISNLHQS